MPDPSPVISYAQNRVQAGTRVESGFSAHSPSNMQTVSTLQSVSRAVDHKESPSQGLLQAS